MFLYFLDMCILNAHAMYQYNRDSHVNIRIFLKLLMFEIEKIVEFNSDNRSMRSKCDILLKFIR